MADHVREQILSAIKTAVTGLTTTGSNVFRSRVTPLARTEVPALIIRAGREARLNSTLGAPRQHERSLVVEVVAVVRAASAYDADLNAIFKEVEPVLAMPIVLAGVNRITLEGIGAPQATQGEEQLAQAAMLYEVVYITQENAPDVAH